MRRVESSRSHRIGLLGRLAAQAMGQQGVIRRGQCLDVCDFSIYFAFDVAQVQTGRTVLKRERTRQDADMHFYYHSLSDIQLLCGRYCLSTRASSCHITRANVRQHRGK